MNTSKLAVIGALLLILIYQTWVSMYVSRASEYDAKQRIVQVFIVWLVPVIGAMLCHLFLSTSRRNEARTDFKLVRQSPTDAGPED